MLSDLNHVHSYVHDRKATEEEWVFSLFSSPTIDLIRER